GGSEDGVVGETLRLDSTAPEAQDATMAEAPLDAVEVQEALDQVVEYAATATNTVDRSFQFETRSTGKVGSAIGTGRRAWGKGDGRGGMPRDQRWFINFSEQDTREEYARQLDYFGIELGALLPEGKLVYLSKLSGGRAPQMRTVMTGADEKR